MIDIFFPEDDSDTGCSRSNTTFRLDFASFGKDFWELVNNAFFRFPGVGIAKGSTINYACLILQSYREQDISATMDVIIYGNAADDAVAPTSKNENDGLDLTTATARWLVETTVAWSAKEQYESDDLSSIVQEIVNRDEWAAGNAIMILCRDNGSTTSGAFQAVAHQVPEIGSGWLIPELYLDWTEPEGSSVDLDSGPAIEIEAHAPKHTVNVADIPCAEIEILARPPSVTWMIPAGTAGDAQIIFRCILTGAANGLDNLDLPMSSFQARVRSGTPSYLSVVVPGLDHIEAISARQNGQILIRKGFRLPSGSELLEEILRVNYDSMQIHQGAQSTTAIIAGYKTSTLRTSKEWEVRNVSFYGLQADGKRRIRADFDLFLRVGDLCIYGPGGNDWFVVGMITYWATATPAMMYMEVQEA